MIALDMHQLIMHRIINPKEEADEIRMFLFHNNRANHLKYSRKNITEAEQLQDTHREIS